MEKTLEKLNALPAADATAELLKCCGSTRWAQRMSGARPFRNAEALLETADRIWWKLDATDWLEAFRSHPKIGETKAAASVSAESRRWSEGEQAGTRGASQSSLDALAEDNRVYENRFGYIFIVCATGKSTEEMLQLLRARLSNDPEIELRIAAEEQRRITNLRLQKLLNQQSAFSRQPSARNDAV